MNEILKDITRLCVLAFCVLIFNDLTVYIRKRNWFKIGVGICLLTYFIYTASKFV